MALLLVCVLIVSIANLLLVAAYLAHEMGWFPHGKVRRLPVLTLTRLERPPHVEAVRLGRRPLGIERPHPTADILRRIGHPDVYDDPDAAAALERAIADSRKDADDWSRHDDVLGLVNSIGSRSERSERENRLIEEAIALLAGTRGAAADGQRS